MALTRWRLTDPDHVDYFASLQWIVRLEDGIDSFFAGVALVGGAGMLVERARGRSPKSWGPGRWVWFLVASYLFLKLLDPICSTVSQHIWAVGLNQASLIQDVIEGFRWKYGEFLLRSTSWFILAFGLTALVAGTPRDPNPDSREWAGWAFAFLLVSTVLALKTLLLLGYPESMMGGGMG
jgi:hypothetical protein